MIIVPIVKIIIFEKKTTLPIAKKPRLESSKGRNRKIKVNELSTPISTKNRGSNELLYTGAKLVCDKISVALKNPK